MYTENDLVSIIIPVYNTEQYVEECLRSIINQTYQNTEIIIIDDGSVDESGIICRRLAQQNDRLKYYWQSNQGVVLARQKGLEIAKGEFVIFVDSDDYIDETLVEKLMNNRDDYDLVTSGIYSEDIEMQSHDMITAGGYRTKEELFYIYERMLFKDGVAGILGYMCAKLLKRELAESVLRAVPRELCLDEDMVFVCQYILRCKRIKVTHICEYYYRQRALSAVHSVNLHFLKNLDVVYNSLNEVFRKHDAAEILMPQLEDLLYRSLQNVGYVMRLHNLEPKRQYIFPLIKEVCGKKIILYGAGVWGKRYKKFLDETNICIVKCWVDKNWINFVDNQERINPVADIFNMNFDVLVIAVAKERVAEEIKRELIEQGIYKEKILWKPPIETVMR